jgi:hypothetical protein
MFVPLQQPFAAAPAPLVPSSASFTTSMHLSEGRVGPTLLHLPGNHGGLIPTLVVFFVLRVVVVQEVQSQLDVVVGADLFCCLLAE